MSMRKAINEKCKDCIYDPKSGGGTWRQQVEACTITTCSLWPMRPKAKPNRAITDANSTDPLPVEGV
jgi:hypothetical protein